jgi:hypothetical protein
MEVQAREPQMGLTFEKVWAMFLESDRQMRELQESQKATDRQMKETDRKIEKLSRNIVNAHTCAPYQFL